jgi:hypothetical protein
MADDLQPIAVVDDEESLASAGGPHNALKNPSLPIFGRRLKQRRPALILDF